MQVVALLAARRLHKSSAEAFTFPENLKVSELKGMSSAKPKQCTRRPHCVKTMNNLASTTIKGGIVTFDSQVSIGN